MSAVSPSTTLGLRGARRVPAPALLVVTVSSAQFGSATAAKVIEHTGPAGAVLLRQGFAALVLVALVRPAVRRMSREQLLLALVFALDMVAMNLCFYEAISRLPLGVVVTIEFLGPLSVAVAYSHRRLEFVWIVLAAVGVVVLARPGGHALDTVGLVYTFAAAALWATYIVLARHMGARFDGAQGIAVSMAMGALIMVIPGVLGAGSELVSVRVLALGLAASMLSSAIPYTLEIEALRRMSPTAFGVFMSLEPGVATLAGFVVLGQTLSATDLVAVALVVAASIGAALTGAPNEALEL